MLSLDVFGGLWLFTIWCFWMHMVRVGPILLAFLAARAFQHLSSTTVASHIGCVSPPFRLQAVPIDFSVRLLCSAAQGFPKGTAQPRPSFHFNGSAFVGRWVWGRHCCRAQRWTWLDLYPHVGSFGKRSFGPRYDSRFSEPRLELWQMKWRGSWDIPKYGSYPGYRWQPYFNVRCLACPMFRFGSDLLLVKARGHCFWYLISHMFLFESVFLLHDSNILLVKSSTISNWISLFVAPSPPGVAAMQAQWWGQAPQEQIFILVLCSVLGDYHWWLSLRSITDDGKGMLINHERNEWKWHEMTQEAEEATRNHRNHEELVGSTNDSVLMSGAGRPVPVWLYALGAAELAHDLPRRHHGVSVDSTHFCNQDLFLKYLCFHGFSSCI